MEDYEEVFGPVSTGFYIVLTAITATLLLRTGAMRYPTGLDFVVAIFFGGLALGTAKLLSYAVREYLLDIIYHSGDAIGETPGATQTNNITRRSDVKESSAAPKTSPLSETAIGEFLQYGNKQVRISPAEWKELNAAIDMSVISLGDMVQINNRDLYLKLRGLGLVDGERWTPAGVIHFGIPTGGDDRPDEDYDFIPGVDGELEWDKVPSTISPI